MVEQKWKKMKIWVIEIQVFFFFIKESRKKFTKFELLLLYKKMVF